MTDCRANFEDDHFITQHNRDLSSHGYVKGAAAAAVVGWGAVVAGSIMAVK